MEKKNTGLVVLVIILSLLVLGLGGYIVYDKLLSENNEEIPKDENNNKIVEDNVENEMQQNTSFNSNWINYLLSTHILEAKISRLRSVDLGDDYDLNKTVTISMNDLKNILTDLEDNKLIKTYSNGRGGPDKDHLTIKYEYNEKIYKFEIFYGSISVTSLDEELKNILNDNNYEEKDLQYKDVDGSFYFYDIDNYSDSIFDSYFN